MLLGLLAHVCVPIARSRHTAPNCSMCMRLIFWAVRMRRRKCSKELRSRCSAVVRRRTNLLHSRAFYGVARNRKVEFVHDLWQAYFAARAMRESPDLSPLVDQLTDPSWRETILFYAGLGEASALVETIIARAILSWLATCLRMRERCALSYAIALHKT